MSADRIGWPTHRAKAHRAKAERRRQLKIARAARRLEQRHGRPEQVTS